jgi:polyhydroxyalkanoate depolymerase
MADSRSARLATAAQGDGWILAIGGGTGIRTGEDDSRLGTKVRRVASEAGHRALPTDWHSAREVPLRAGRRFGLDEYTEHLMRFLRAMHAPDSARPHLMAICQPCVAALAATALMSADEHPATPASLTLMAGPIDCRISPTAVNALATSKPIDWFERNLISQVPLPLKGAGRRVYPGFVQVSAFMGMNRQRHVDAFRTYYQGLVDDEPEVTEPIRRFYEEYLAVSDLPAEFYLETVRLVFQEYALPLGQLSWRGRQVDPSAIRRTALLDGAWVPAIAWTGIDSVFALASSARQLDCTQSFTIKDRSGGGRDNLSFGARSL